MDDNSIVDLFWQRDERAIAETEKKYGAYCMKISMNILCDKSDSEENVNDTYMRAWESIPPTRPNILSAFLGRIARNLALNKYKSSRAGKRFRGELEMSLDELDECTPSRASVEDEAGAAELGRHISNFLRELPSDARGVFVCRYFYFDAIGDIAERYGFGESKVKSMLMRCRTRLKKYLEKEGYTL